MNAVSLSVPTKQGNITISGATNPDNVMVSIHNRQTGSTALGDLSPKDAEELIIAVATVLL